MLKRRSDIVPEIPKKSLENKETPFVINEEKLNKTISNIEEGFFFDLFKNKLFGEETKTEYITKEDSEYLKYAFTNIYIDSLFALSFPLKVERMFLDTDKYVNKIQKRLKDNINKFKRKENLIDVDNFLNTGYYKPNKQLITILDEVVKKIQSYIKNNLDKIIYGDLPTTPIHSNHVGNMNVQKAYKDLFDYTFNSADKKGRNQYEIIAVNVLKQIKEMYGLDLSAMIINEDIQKTNKYLKNNIPSKIEPKSEENLKKEIEKFVEKPEIKKEEEKTVEIVNDETIKKEEVVVKKEKKQNLETSKEDTLPSTSTTPKVEELTDKFIDNVIDMYFSKKEYIRTKRLINGVTSDIKSAFKEMLEKGEIPTEESIYNKITVDN